MKVHHIGYAVQNIDKALSSFERMGFYKVTDTVRDQIRKVDICFISDQDNKNMIELIAPFEKGSDVDGVLEKWGGPNPYHICYEVESIDSFMADYGKKCFVIKKPEEAETVRWEARRPMVGGD